MHQVDLEQLLTPRRNGGEVEFGNEIGQGHFGTVYHGILQSQVEVAIKEASDNEAKMDILHEARTIALVQGFRQKSPYILNLRGHGIHYIGSHMYLLLEYCPNGDLDTFLKKTPQIKEIARTGDYGYPMRWCRQVAKAMDFLLLFRVKHVSQHF